MEKYMNFKKYTTSILTLIIAFISLNALADINLDDLEKALKTTGLVGEIHGASNDSKLYVFTYRNPDNFFENIQLPLTTESTDIGAQLITTKRHQFYKITGEFLDNKAPIKHINIKSMVLTKDYTSELDQTAYQYKTDLNTLYSRKSFIARVHAVAEDGKMLVVEYGDRIVPVVVLEAEQVQLVKTFYRGDLIKLFFSVRKSPEAPTHLNLEKKQNLDPNTNPVELLESLVKSHGSPIEKTGYLIKFPKSPQINTNIYALLVEDVDGSTIQYTLTNLEDPKIFKATREKCEKIWNENQGLSENDRNKFVNRHVIVHAKGKSNMVDRGQANPQIILSSVDDLEFTIK
jgi:hypothetical protein